MAIKREDGAVQPGIKWWRFTTRIPGIHVDLNWPLIVQGGLMTMATAAAAAPLFMGFFGVSFEVGWALASLPLGWYWIQAFLFGLPYNPGWITPALPLVLMHLGRYDVGVPTIQAMTALALTVAFIMLFFAITGLGEKFFSWIPIELRAGIILGSAIAAFMGEFNRLETAGMPITMVIVWAVVFLLMFSIWISDYKTKSRFVRQLATFAMLIGFLVAGGVGPLVGEVTMQLQWGLFIPPFGEAIRSVSPFFVGWPTWDMFVTAFPLAILVYVVAFGDMILANTLLADADHARPDEKILTNTTTLHYSLFFRNLGQVLTFGPLIPMHGPIWTGVAVFIIEQYKEGRKQMESIFTGVINWYWLAFILVFLWPVVSFMRPILPVALSITLILTGFACAYIAMRMVDTPTSRGYALFIGLIIFKYGAAWGLGVGLLMFFLLLVQRKPIVAIPYDDESDKVIKK